MRLVTYPERVSGFYITGFTLIDLNSLITESIDEISTHYGKSA